MEINVVIEEGLRRLQRDGIGEILVVHPGEDRSGKRRTWSQLKVANAFSDIRYHAYTEPAFPIGNDLPDRVRSRQPLEVFPNHRIGFRSENYMRHASFYNRRFEGVLFDEFQRRGHCGSLLCYAILASMTDSREDEAAGPFQDEGNGESVYAFATGVVSEPDRNGTVVDQ